MQLSLFSFNAHSSTISGYEPLSAAKLAQMNQFIQTINQLMSDSYPQILLDYLTRLYQHYQDQYKEAAQDLDAVSAERKNLSHGDFFKAMAQVVKKIKKFNPFLWIRREFLKLKKAGGYTFDNQQSVLLDWGKRNFPQVMEAIKVLVDDHPLFHLSNQQLLDIYTQRLSALKHYHEEALEELRCCKKDIDPHTYQNYHRYIKKLLCQIQTVEDDILNAMAVRVKIFTDTQKHHSDLMVQVTGAVGEVPPTVLETMTAEQYAQFQTCLQQDGASAYLKASLQPYPDKIVAKSSMPQKFMWSFNAHSKKSMVVPAQLATFVPERIKKPDFLYKGSNAVYKFFDAYQKDFIDLQQMPDIQDWTLNPQDHHLPHLLKETLHALTHKQKLLDDLLLAVRYQQAEFNSTWHFWRIHHKRIFQMTLALLENYQYQLIQTKLRLAEKIMRNYFLSRVVVNGWHDTQSFTSVRREFESLLIQLEKDTAKNENLHTRVAQLKSNYHLMVWQQVKNKLLALSNESPFISSETLEDLKLCLVAFIPEYQKVVLANIDICFTRLTGCMADPLGLRLSPALVSSVAAVLETCRQQISQQPYDESLEIAFNHVENKYVLMVPAREATHIIYQAANGSPINAQTCHLLQNTFSSFTCAQQRLFCAHLQEEVVSLEDQLIARLSGLMHMNVDMSADADAGIDSESETHSWGDIQTDVATEIDMRSDSYTDDQSDEEIEWVPLKQMGSDIDLESVSQTNTYTDRQIDAQIDTRRNHFTPRDTMLEAIVSLQKILALLTSTQSTPDCTPPIHKKLAPTVLILFKRYLELLLQESADRVSLEEADKLGAHDADNLHDNHLALMEASLLLFPELLRAQTIAGINFYEFTQKCRQLRLAGEDQRFELLTYVQAYYPVLQATLVQEDLENWCLQLDEAIAKCFSSTLSMAQPSSAIQQWRLLLGTYQAEARELSDKMQHCYDPHKQALAITAFHTAWQHCFDTLPKCIGVVENLPAMPLSNLPVCLVIDKAPEKLKMVALKPITSCYAGDAHLFARSKRKSLLTETCDYVRNFFPHF